jgi:hypothetical protein
LTGQSSSSGGAWLGGRGSQSPRWRRMCSMTSFSSITDRKRISPPQWGQTRGSSSYTFFIRRAQAARAARENSGSTCSGTPLITDAIGSVSATPALECLSARSLAAREPLLAFAREGFRSDLYLAPDGLASAQRTERCRGRLGS